MTTCRDCGAMVSTKARACPSCGAPRGRGRGCGWFLLWAIVLLVSLWFVVILPQVRSVTSMKMAESGWLFIRDSGRCSIKGEAENVSGSELRSVIVEFNLYDSSGAQVGTALDTTSNLDAGATWKFEAIGYAPTATTAQFRGFRAY